ncbi:MAG: carbohydrate kinase family protein [Kiritimatiellae bacterium]|nr:carbohydrate kinase family protein [Kiritimatiellia bacterium]
MIPDRHGIACAGNWIIDRVKIVDHLPGKGMLGSILSETSATGGAPFNVLVDLGRMKAKFPLAGIGVIGNDSGMNFISSICAPLKIDTSRLIALQDEPTSYTDVMTEADTGVRVFYHYRGANARFSPEHVNVAGLPFRIFHLGYLLLLDGMDQPDPDCGTAAAKLLKKVQKAGIKTSVDVVSDESDRFARIVPASLPYTDYLILNEIEAGRTTGTQVRDDSGKLIPGGVVDAVDALYELGRMELVAVHMPEGAYLKTRNGKKYSQGSLRLPENYIKGTVGAGDAFCAGMLYGLHESWDAAKTLKLGACAAAACLAQPGATDGLRPLNEVMELGKRFPEHEPPVAV